MTTYEIVQQISKETNVTEETVDEVLTEMTNVLNETFLSENGSFGKLLKLAKKKEGLAFLIEETTSRVDCAEPEEVKTVVGHMINIMGKSLKSGGVKNILKILKSLKNAQ